MNRKAVYGVLLAVLLPLIGYLYVKKYSDRDVVMPRHYVPDSVSTITRNGKQYDDTTWHQVRDFTLTNQLGQQVSMKDMRGKIIVANFFFTHCPNICPNATRAMKLLQDVIKSPEKVGDRDPNFVQFLSFSIDPGRDSVSQLKKWNDLFQINAQEWWLLTGDRKTIYERSTKDLDIMAEDGNGIDSNFLHTDMIVVIDTNHYVRGYYHALKPKPNPNNTIDTANILKLSEDIILLSLEKDPKRKFLLADKLGLIITVFIIAAVAVFILVVLLKRNKL